MNITASSKLGQVDKNTLQTLCDSSASYRQILNRLGLKGGSANYPRLKHVIKLLEIDISTLDKNRSRARKEHVTKIAFRSKPLEEYLVDNREVNNVHLKSRLISEGLRQYLCEKCGLSSWLDQPITLHLHHINGKRTDNRLENLAILCPNCHSITDTYAGKGSRRKATPYCPQCGEPFCGTGKMCPECWSTSQRVVSRPPLEKLLIEVEHLGYTGTGRKYGVSDNAIRKWIKQYNKQLGVV